MLLVLEPRCEQQRPRMRLSVGQREDACYDPPGVNDIFTCTFVLPSTIQIPYRGQQAP